MQGRDALESPRPPSFRHPASCIFGSIICGHLRFGVASRKDEEHHILNYPGTGAFSGVFKTSLKIDLGSGAFSGVFKASLKTYRGGSTFAEVPSVVGQL